MSYAFHRIYLILKFLLLFTSIKESCIPEGYQTLGDYLIIEEGQVDKARSFSIKCNRVTTLY